MTEMLGTRELLQTQRIKCLSSLRSLSPRAEQLVNELESIDLALEKLARLDIGRYAGYRVAIEAIVAALRIHERAMTTEELQHEIVSGGWLNEDGRARLNVKDSIDYHVRRQGKSRKIIRAVDDLIGLYDWPDEKFQHPINRQ